ncbi:MAG TPA: DUF5658 family protein [Candidatus Binatia bacterium]|nr:DUF5658 family protein [Candidatus Binatia bacterium]
MRRLLWLARAVVLLQPPFSRLRALVVTNMGLQILDGHLTLRGLSRGFTEGNPIVNRAIELVGPLEGVLAMKLFAIGVLYLLYRNRRRLPHAGAALVSLAIAYVAFAIVPWAMLLATTSG